MTYSGLKDLFTELSIESKTRAEKFIKLSYNQINWKPADSQWSIGECFEHLIRTNNKYLESYEKNKASGKVDSDPVFKQTLTGRFILKSVKPQNTKKFKTSAEFNPAGSNIKESVINDFIKQVDEFIFHVNNFDPLNLQKKITSPFSKLVKYNFGDSFLIIANHNLRHVMQAERVIQNENFPQS